MKAVFLSLLACVLLVGCRAVEHRADAIIFTDTLRLAPGDADIDIEAQFACNLTPPEDAELVHLAKECLIEAYQHARGERYEKGAACGARSICTAFFNDYTEDFNDNWPEVSAGNCDKHILCWNCTIEGRVEYYDNDYFSYRVTIDTYCGGAHPNRWVQNATYSRHTGRRLKVSDLIQDNQMTAVVNLIRRNLRNEPHDDVLLQAHLENEIHQPYDEYVRDIRNGKIDEWGNPLVTDNFRITQNGIIWTYNQYEIACYASGLFDVLVPWRDLRPYLKK